MKKKKSLTGPKFKKRNRQLFVSFSKFPNKRAHSHTHFQLCARVEKKRNARSSYPFATVPYRARASGHFCIDGDFLSGLLLDRRNIKSEAKEFDFLKIQLLGKCFTRLCWCPLEAGWSFDAALLLLLRPRCPGIRCYPRERRKADAFS